jgi:hypothetical protein
MGRGHKSKELQFSLGKMIFDSKKDVSFETLNLCVTTALRAREGFMAHTEREHPPEGVDPQVWKADDAQILSALLGVLDQPMTLFIQVMEPDRRTVFNVWNMLEGHRLALATDSEATLIRQLDELRLSQHDTMRLYLLAHKVTVAKLLRLRGHTVRQQTLEDLKGYWKKVLEGIDATRAADKVHGSSKDKATKFATQLEITAVAAARQIDEVTRLEDFSAVLAAEEKALNDVYQRVSASSTSSSSGAVQHVGLAQIQLPSQPAPAAARCTRCGSNNHGKDAVCNFQGPCNRCGEIGHMARVCQATKEHQKRFKQAQQQQRQQRPRGQQQGQQQQQQQQPQNRGWGQQQQQRPQNRGWQQQQQRPQQQQQGSRPQFYQQSFQQSSQPPQLPQQQQQFFTAPPQQQFFSAPQAASGSWVQRWEPYVQLQPQQYDQQQQQQQQQLQQQQQPQQQQQQQQYDTAFFGQEYPPPGSGN